MLFIILRENIKKIFSNIWIWVVMVVTILLNFVFLVIIPTWFQPPTIATLRSMPEVILWISLPICVYAITYLVSDKPEETYVLTRGISRFTFMTARILLLTFIVSILSAILSVMFIFLSNSIHNLSGEIIYEQWWKMISIFIWGYFCMITTIFFSRFLNPTFALSLIIVVMLVWIAWFNLLSNPYDETLYEFEKTFFFVIPLSAVLPITGALLALTYWMFCKNEWIKL